MKILKYVDIVDRISRQKYINTEWFLLIFKTIQKLSKYIIGQYEKKSQGFAHNLTSNILQYQQHINKYDILSVIYALSEQHV